MIGFPKGFMFMTLPAYAGGELVTVFQYEDVLQTNRIKLDGPGHLFLAEAPGPKDWSPVETIPKNWKWVATVPTKLLVVVTVAYLNIEGFSTLLHHTFSVPKPHALYFVPL